MEKTFERGVYLPHYKESTDQSPVQELPLPKQLVIPMRQHIGAPNTPLVKVGDKVTAGQKVGDSQAFVSAPVHSGLSGTVSAVEQRIALSGQEVECVVVDVNEKQTAAKGKKRDISKLSNDELRKLIREAGIIGMGGAAFPAHVKLDPPKPIEYLIINGCECEPFLTCDHRTMLEEIDEMIEGARLDAKLVGSKKIIFGVETNKIDAIELLEEKLKDEPDMEVTPVAVKYPQGSEKQLIYATVGRSVPPGKLPFDIGVVVQNVASVVAVYNAVYYGQPSTERIVTFTGHSAGKPGNYRVVVGTPISHIIEHAGGLKEDVARVIAGGPMTGTAQATLDAPTDKGCGGIVALNSEVAATPVKHLPCVRCAKCVDHCPMFLYPNYISTYGEGGNYDKAKQWGAEDCFECGICAYVCPSSRPIVEYVRRAKQA